MYSEACFLEISKIPNQVWKRNKLELSPGFSHLWSESKRTLSIKIESVLAVEIIPLSVCIILEHSHIQMPLDSIGFRCLVF